MSKYLDNVGKFHKAFNHPVEDVIKEDNLDIRELRLKLLFEELEELSEAMGCQSTMNELCSSVLDKNKIDNSDVYDKYETLDALCDIQYVLSGAVLAMGYTNVFDDAFQNIQDSNMSKMCNSMDEVNDSINKYKERGETLHIHPIEKDGKYILVRSDGKIMKNMYYTETDLNRFIA